MTELVWTELDKRAVDTARVLAADAVQKVGNGHPGTAISLAPVAYLLYQKVMKGDPVKTPIWDTYKDIVAHHDTRGADAVGTIERFAFYKEASTAYAIVTTGESAVYANVMLQKGVVQD